VLLLDVCIGENLLHSLHPCSNVGILLPSFIPLGSPSLAKKGLALIPCLLFASLLLQVSQCRRFLYHRQFFHFCLFLFCHRATSINNYLKISYLSAASIISLTFSISSIHVLPSFIITSVIIVISIIIITITIIVIVVFTNIINYVTITPIAFISSSIIVPLFHR
jgi:hypothetical protein